MTRFYCFVNVKIKKEPEKPWIRYKCSKNGQLHNDSRFSTASSKFHSRWRIPCTSWKSACPKYCWPCSLSVTSCSVGVPHGCVLGPLLFSVYTSPLSTIAQVYNVFNSSVQVTHKFMSLCLPTSIVTALQHSSLVCPHFVSGSAKTVWCLIQPNQTPFSLSHLRGSSLCLALLLLM